MTGKLSPELEQLLEAAYRQTLARFRDEVNRGLRDPAAERDSYRRRRRDYASLLRLETVPEEARSLAQQLLETHHIALDPPSQRLFELETTRLLVSLYDAFIDFADNTSQGRR